MGNMPTQVPMDCGLCRKSWTQSLANTKGAPISFEIANVAKGEIKNVTY